VLKSTGVRSTWRPGVNTAVCANGYPHKRGVPDHDCKCGLYALHDTSWQVPFDPYTIAGAIAAQGHIEVHHAGFRAEKAQIVALADSRFAINSELKAVIEKVYGVPFVPLDMLVAEGLRHGDVVPMSVRPKRSEVPRER
jgi:hypothetical protein